MATVRRHLARLHHAKGSLDDAERNYRISIDIYREASAGPPAHGHRAPRIRRIEGGRGARLSPPWVPCSIQEHGRLVGFDHEASNPCGIFRLSFGAAAPSVCIAIRAPIGCPIALETDKITAWPEHLRWHYLPDSPPNFG